MNTRPSVLLPLTALLTAPLLVIAQQTPAPPAAPINTRIVQGVPMVPLQTNSAAARPTPAAPLQLLKVGAVAPDFAATDLAGKTEKLSDFQGKVVVLDFWATWCGPCMKSLPHTQEAAKQYKDQGVVVLANCTSDTRAKFEEWTKANQAKYADIHFACDPNEKGSATFEERASKKLYGVSGIPTQFVIGRDGKVVAALVGYLEGDVLLEAGLARAGIKVDPTLVAKGEEQIKKREEQMEARARAAGPPASR